MTLTQEDELLTYCKKYFTCVGASILPSADGSLCVELPRDVDKELTDRPFYWMWVEAMNESPANTILYLIFDKNHTKMPAIEGVKPELVTPGCYRMQRILLSAKSRGMFAAAYEASPVLTPFALFIVKVSFVSDLRKDFLESYAIDLREYIQAASDRADVLGQCAVRCASDSTASQS